MKRTVQVGAAVIGASLAAVAFGPGFDVMRGVDNDPKWWAEAKRRKPQKLKKRKDKRNK